MTLLVSLNQVLLHRLQQEVSSEVCNLWISSYFSFSIHHSNHGGLMTRTWTGVGLICLPDFENKGHSQRTHTTYFDKKTGRKTGEKQPKIKSGAFKRPGSRCLLSFLSAAKPKPADFQRVWFFRQMSYRFAVSTRHSALGTRHSALDGILCGDVYPRNPDPKSFQIFQKIHPKSWGLGFWE